MKHVIRNGVEYRVLVVNFVYRIFALKILQNMLDYLFNSNEHFQYSSMYKLKSDDKITSLRYRLNHRMKNSYRPLFS